MPNLTNNIDSGSQIWFPICYHGNINQIMIIIIIDVIILHV